MSNVLLDSSTYVDLERAPRYRNRTWAISTVRKIISYRQQFGNPYLSMASVIEILQGLSRDLNPLKADLFKSVVETDFQLIEIDRNIAMIAGENMGNLD